MLGLLHAARHELKYKARNTTTAQPAMQLVSRLHFHHKHTALQQTLKPTCHQPLGVVHLPDMTYLASGLKLTWHAYPAVLCPLKFFLRFCLKRSFVMYVTICTAHTNSQMHQAKIALLPPSAPCAEVASNCAQMLADLLKKSGALDT